MCGCLSKQSPLAKPNVIKLASEEPHKDITQQSESKLCAVFCDIRA